MFQLKYKVGDWVIEVLDDWMKDEVACTFHITGINLETGKYHYTVHSPRLKDEYTYMSYPFDKFEPDTRKLTKLELALK